jgi:preprotein translocase subunit SecD
MELFREPNFNFLRWKWHWIGVSLILLVAGVGSLVVKGGPRYGIDFSGGTLVYLKFAQSPDLNRIRDALREHGMGSSTIQAYGRPDNNEIIIGAEQVGSEDEALDASREAILGTLRTTFGVPGDRLDLNNAGTTTLSESLQSLDPLALSSSPTEAVTRYQQQPHRGRDPLPGDCGTNHQLSRYRKRRAGGEFREPPGRRRSTAGGGEHAGRAGVPLTLCRA